MKIKIASSFIVLSLLFLAISPAFFSVVSGINSYSYGAIIAGSMMLFGLLVFNNQLSYVKVRLRYLLPWIMILLHGALIYANQPMFDLSRLIYSYVPLLIIFLIIQIFSSSYSYHLVSDKVVIKFVYIMVFLLLVTSITMVLNINIFSYPSSKPSFIYKEPSHFAIGLCPFLFFFFCSLSKIKSLIIFMFFLMLAFYVQNLTLIAVTFLCYLLSPRDKFFKLFFIFLLLLVFYIHFKSVIPSIDYFLDRVYLSSESNNLTVLVLLGGIENAMLTFLKTNGLGVGFQQYGVLSEVGDISKKAIIINGGWDGNKYDGGTLVAKMLSEFGLLSFVFFIVFFLTTSLLFVKVFRGYSALFERLFLGYSVALSFELLLRGSGYFSSTILIYICFWFAYMYGERNKSLAF